MGTSNDSALATMVPYARSVVLRRKAFEFMVRLCSIAGNAPNVSLSNVVISDGFSAPRTEGLGFQQAGLSRRFVKNAVRIRSLHDERKRNRYGCPGSVDCLSRNDVRADGTFRADLVTPQRFSGRI
jgi:hypothetical protein